MVVAKLTEENYANLKDVIGNAFSYFECSELDNHNRTYGNIQLNFNTKVFEICNEQKPLTFYDDIEDIAFFTMKSQPSNAQFLPYILEEYSQKYKVGETVVGINVIEDTINIVNENYQIVFDMAIEIITVDNTYTFSKGWFFDEYIYYTKNQEFERIYPKSKVIFDWDEESPHLVEVTRRYISLNDLSQ